MTALTLAAVDLLLLLAALDLATLWTVQRWT